MEPVRCWPLDDFPMEPENDSIVSGVSRTNVKHTYYKEGRHLCRPLVHTQRKEEPQMIREDWVYRRGDIYYADLTQYLGSEQGGIRPVVVIQNNRGNYHAPTLIVATVTSRADKKLNQPTHFLIRKNAALKKPSVVQLEQLFTIDKQRVQRYLGKLTDRELFFINRALAISLSLTALNTRK